MKTLWLYELALFMLTCTLVGGYQEPGKFPPVEMKGGNYKPPNDKSEIEKLPAHFKESFQFRELYLPTDLSDWERLKRMEEQPIQSVTVHGFWKLSEGGKNVNIKIATDEALKQFQSGISPDYMMRPAESDIGRSGGAFGGGVYLGVIQITMQNGEKILIGVGHTNFFLDVYYGSVRQSFYSRPLAEALRRCLSANGMALPDKDYEDLSGLSRTKLPDEFDKR